MLAATPRAAASVEGITVMASEVLEYLAGRIQKTSEQLIEAVEDLPEDKRNWRVEGKARSAGNQAAECALMNGEIASLLATRQWPDNYSFEEFGQRVEKLSADWGATKSKLQENATVLSAAIQDLSASDLPELVQMPWGPMSVQEIITYPVWNMSYHEGQARFIGALA